MEKDKRNKKDKKDKKDKISCEYCDSKFSTKNNLKIHQKNAKFCLAKRETLSENYHCEYCSKILSSKFRLEEHLVICKIKEQYIVENKIKEITNHYENLLNKEKNNYENLNKIMNERYEEKLVEKNLHIDELKKQIQNLQDQIKEFTTLAIGKTTSINYNNHTNNNQNQIKNIDNRTVNMIPFNLTTESIRETLQNKFSEAHLMKGQKGVAEFMIENVLVSGENDNKKFLMKCTDPSRKIFITLDEEGKVFKDVNADNLTKMISGPVKEVSHKLYQEIQDRFFTMYESVPNELEDGDKEKEDLAIENERLDYATNRVCEISRLKNNNTEFVKNLISPLSN